MQEPPILQNKGSVMALGVERVRMHWVVDSQVMTNNPIVRLPSYCRTFLNSTAI